MNDEELKKYSASYYDHFACKQQILSIKAANRFEAICIALMVMGKIYNIDDIDTLEEEDDKYYYTYEDACNKYKARYNEDPLLPEAKWDEEEQAWYYKEDEDGERYYI